MKKALVKTADMVAYPYGDVAKRYVNKDAKFELMIADHAYIRMQQRIRDAYEKFAKPEESEMKFFERVACEACVRILQIGIQPGGISVVKIVRHDVVWVYNFVQDAPMLITLYPRKWFKDVGKEARDN